MPARKLEHFNIWTTQCEETIRFYVEILGLTVGPRPAVGIPGAWLYDSTKTPVVHLVDVEKSSAEELAAAGGRDIDSLNGSGSIDHIAFEAADFEELSAKLTAAGLKFRIAGIPAISLRQIFVADPNGIVIELNFRSS